MGRAEAREAQLRLFLLTAEPERVLEAKGGVDARRRGQPQGGVRKAQRFGEEVWRRVTGFSADEV